jgi:hypothetical protein
LPSSSPLPDFLSFDLFQRFRSSHSPHLLLTKAEHSHDEPRDSFVDERNFADDFVAVSMPEVGQRDVQVDHKDPMVLFETLDQMLEGLE